MPGYTTALSELLGATATRMSSAGHTQPANMLNAMSAYVETASSIVDDPSYEAAARSGAAMIGMAAVSYGIPLVTAALLTASSGAILATSAAVVLTLAGSRAGEIVYDSLLTLVENAYSSPLILDLDGDGVELLPLENSEAFFDLDGNGFAEKTGWVASDDALLAIDSNGDGKISNINELFGNESTDGFVELSTLDSNSDNLIDVNDAQFSELLLWQDANENGISEAGELTALTNTNIESINLAYTSSSAVISGHPISSTSSFTKTDTSSGEIVDAWFQHDKINSYYQLSDEFEYHEDVYRLPALRGYGEIPGLWVQMTLDESLRTAVNNIIGQDFTNFSFADLETRLNL